MLLALGWTAALAGYAGAFPTVDVPVPLVENPGSGPALRIGPVADARVFERVPLAGYVLAASSPSSRR